MAETTFVGPPLVPAFKPGELLVITHPQAPSGDLQAMLDAERLYMTLEEYQARNRAFLESLSIDELYEECTPKPARAIVDDFDSIRIERDRIRREDAEAKAKAEAEREKASTTTTDTAYGWFFKKQFGLG